MSNRDVPETTRDRIRRRVRKLEGRYIAGDMKDEAQSWLRKQKIFSTLHKYTSKISKAANIWMDLRDKPRTSDYLSAMARVLDMLIEANNDGNRVRDMFDEGWEYVTPSMVKLVMESMTVDATQELRGTTYSLGSVGTCLVGAAAETAGAVTAWHREGEEKDLYPQLRELAWKRIGSKWATLDDDKIAKDLTMEQVKDLKITTQFAELAQTLKAYANAGHNRSVLLVGPPGTGKSIGSMTLAHALGLSCLRTVVPESNYGSSISSVADVVMTLAPEMVILDDIDRSRTGSGQLRLLEEMNRTVKVVVATANRVDSITPAMLRPGRFDDLVAVTRLDHEFFNRMMGPLDADVMSILRDLPVAYLQDYKKRIAVGQEAPLDIANNLANRFNKEGKLDLKDLL